MNVIPAWIPGRRTSLAATAVALLCLLAVSVGHSVGFSNVASTSYGPSNPAVPYVQPLPFEQGGAFRRQIANVAVDANSPSYVAQINALVQKDGAFVNSNAYGDAIYIVNLSTPVVPVYMQYKQTSVASLMLQGVPMPANAAPATGTDGYLSVYAPATHRMWDFWRASTPAENAPGAGPLPWGQPSWGDAQWHAVVGGAINDIRFNPGYFDYHSVPGYSLPNWGSSATSTVNDARTVLVSEVLAGHIDHAVNFEESVAQQCSSVNAWPAQRNDGNGAAGSCIPEGTFFRIDPKLDLATLNLPPFTLMVATAAQKYGACICESSQGGPSVEVENSQQYGFDAWTPAPTGVLGTLHRWNAMTQFPWTHLQAVQETDRTLGVPPATSTIAVVPSATTIAHGQPVSFKATVFSADGRPVFGALYLTENGQDVAGHVMHSGVGTGTVTVTPKVAGTYSFAVAYGGDETLKGSTSDAFTVVVT